MTPIVPTPPIPTAADARAMSALAKEFTAARRRLDQSRQTGDGLPSLTATANQLQSLGLLINYLTDEVLFRVAEPGHRTPQQRRTVGILATVTASAARAVEYLAGAHGQLGFLHQYVYGPTTPDLADMRNSAVEVIHDRLEEARASLQDASDALNLEADRSGALVSRAAAARGRTTVRNAPTASSVPPEAAPPPPGTGSAHANGR
ncbi:hypothetical protein [Streptomyces tailanensis]|uniref:hypothetical protein n=1 Tax=Streptomyces tailanensis TaxID=2569858 RepID=UPI00122E0CA6|nr:hypothetical protein [Streptomyces tailanensis]